MKRNILLSASAGIISLFFLSNAPDVFALDLNGFRGFVNREESTSEPQVITEEPSHVLYTSALMKGRVDPKNSAIKIWFDFKQVGVNLRKEGRFLVRAQSRNFETPKIPMNGNGERDYYFPVHNLQPNTAYSYRLIAEIGDGEKIYGDTIYFKTLRLPLYITLNSPIPNGEYASLPIDINGSIFVPWCSNQINDLTLRFYLDEELIDEQQHPQIRGRQSINFGTSIKKLTAVGEHEIKIEMYEDDVLRETILRTFRAVTASVDLKINGSDGPLEAELPSPNFWGSFTSNHLPSNTPITMRITKNGVERVNRIIRAEELRGALDLPIDPNKGSADLRGEWRYTVRSTGNFGSAEDTVVIRVKQLPICTFYANPSTIVLPQPSELTWQCAYAESYTLSDSLGREIANTQVVNDTSYISKGTKDIAPNDSTTYVLNVHALDGTRAYTAEIEVIKNVRGWREIIPHP